MKTVVQYDGKWYESISVSEGPTCKGCAFVDKSICPGGGMSCATMRIYYILLSEDTKKEMTT